MHQQDKYTTPSTLLEEKSNAVFSDDICYEILSFLDHNFKSSSLWNYASISKQFMKIIGGRLELNMYYSEMTSQKIELMRRSILSQNVVSLRTERVSDFPKFCTILKSMNQLRRVEICGHHLKGATIKPLTMLKQVTDLVLNENGISELGVIYISGMIQLKSLDIRNNEINVESAKYITQLRKLQYLSVSVRNNEVLTLIGGMKNLTRLRIDRNNIGHDGAKIISRMKQLTSLHISNNSLLSEGARFISSMKKLTELDITNNDIGIMGTFYISELKELTRLCIGFNCIGDEGAKHISGLKHLVHLNVTWNEIGLAGAKSIGELRNLTHLSAGENDIPAEGAKAISQLRNLTYLDIVGNPIGDEGGLAISELTKLTTLFIGVYSLSNCSIDQLKKMKQLRVSDLLDD